MANVNNTSDDGTNDIAAKQESRDSSGDAASQEAATQENKKFYNSYENYDRKPQTQRGNFDPGKEPKESRHDRFERKHEERAKLLRTGLLVGLY